MQKVRWDEVANALKRWTAGGYAAISVAASAITGNLPIAQVEGQVPATQLLATNSAVSGSGDTLTLTAARNISVIATKNGTQAFTLPTIAACGGAGAILFVRKTGTAGAITITAGSGNTIAGGATHATIDAQNDWAMFVAIGTGWVLGINIIA